MWFLAKDAISSFSLPICSVFKVMLACQAQLVLAISPPLSKEIMTRLQGHGTPWSWKRPAEIHLQKRLSSFVHNN